MGISFSHPDSRYDTNAFMVCSKTCLDLIKHHYDSAIEKDKFKEFLRYYKKG
jgi:hypothetical protein